MDELYSLFVDLCAGWAGRVAELRTVDRLSKLCPGHPHFRIGGAGPKLVCSLQQHPGCCSGRMVGGIVSFGGLATSAVSVQAQHAQHVQRSDSSEWQEFFRISV